MKKIATFESEYLRFKIKGIFYLKGDGLVVEIIGPNDHLGGIGVGFPYTRRNGDNSANCNSFSVPSHRDGELAGLIARLIAKNTRKNTIVLLGIHFPHISRSAINDFIKFIEDWISNISRQITPVLDSNIEE
ncbi:MAG: hypothetical protein EAX86_07720 [Candidatus Heimdallarchaeota archaeon]|nr:hypothetical protein [Candidatus Heimdallarchaeota archaeon]